jgi:hypothetical protein
VPKVWVVKILKMKAFVPAGGGLPPVVVNRPWTAIVFGTLAASPIVANPITAVANRATTNTLSKDLLTSNLLDVSILTCKGQ